MKDATHREYIVPVLMDANYSDTCYYAGVTTHIVERHPTAQQIPLNRKEYEKCRFFMSVQVRER